MTGTNYLAKFSVLPKGCKKLKIFFFIIRNKNTIKFKKYFIHSASMKLFISRRGDPKLCYLPLTRD